MERRRRRVSGRRAGRDRPAYGAAAWRSSRTVCAGGSFLRRALRAHVRRPLPRRGCWHGADRFHRAGVVGGGSWVIRRPDVVRRGGGGLPLWGGVGSGGGGGGGG